MRLGAALALIALATTHAARAHEFEPPLLSLTERAAGEFDVFWRIPTRLASDALVPEFPAGSQRSAAQPVRRQGDAWVERFVLRVPGGLGGKRIGLRATAVHGEEALVRIETASGSFNGRVVPGADGFVVPEIAGGEAGVLRTYVALGAEHILIGFDHLLFVLALLLLAPSVGVLAGSITAFTLAHSVTLVLSTLGYVTLSSPPVEASIALSIAFVARELVVRERSQKPSPRARQWAAAFGFGLLHGLGFAGVLGEIGLPSRAIPLSLFSFNLGVELGQLAFVATLLLAARLIPARLRGAVRARRVMPYAIGSVAAFYLIERVAGMLA